MFGRIKVLLSSDSAFWLLLAAALCMGLIPIWAVRFLPMGDLGAHMELMDIVVRLDDPDTLYGQYYTLVTRWDPNSLTHKVAWLLGPYLGVAATAKLLVSWYVVGLPLSMLAMCRAYGRSRWLVFFSSAMTFNALFNIGFLDFLVSLPLFFFVIALSRSLGERGGWIRAGVLGVLLVVLYFAHIIAFMIGFGICLAQLVLWLSRFRSLLRLIPMAFPVPLFASWFIRKFASGEATEAGRVMGQVGEGLGSDFQSWDDLLGQIHMYGLRFFRDNTEEHLVIALLVLWLLLMAISQRQQRDTQPQEGKPSIVSRLRAYTLELVTCCCIVAYFKLPSNLTEVEVVTQRLVMIVLWLLALWPRLEFRRWPERILGALLVLAALIYPWIVKGKFVEFNDKYLGELPEAISALPDGTRLSYVRWGGDNSVTYMGPLWHIPKAIHALENGGITDDSFAVRPTCPIQYRPGMTPHALGRNFWLDPHLDEYDHVLLMSSQRPDSALEESQLVLLFSEEPWWLFEVVQDADRRLVTEVLSVGGTGGSEVEWDCPQGTYLAGFRGQAERYLNNLTPVCTTVTARDVTGAGSSDPADPAASQGRSRGRSRQSQSRGPRFGERLAELASFNALCSATDVVVGIHGRAASAVDSFSIVCAPLDGIREQQAELPLNRLETHGGEGGQPFELLCPAGNAAVGFRGRAGSMIDEAGIACSPTGTAP